jgi:hypothetical protein
MGLASERAVRGGRVCGSRKVRTVNDGLRGDWQEYKSKLFIIEGSLNQDRYIAMLEEIHLIDERDALFGQGNWRFMQNGASCHTGMETMATLSPLVHLARGWPPNSPDLNPIEIVWGWMKHTLNLGRA